MRPRSGLRWAYALGLYLAMGPDGLLTGDSIYYLSLARDMLGAGSLRVPEAWRWLGGGLEVMPLYQWFLLLPLMLGEAAAPLVAVLVQGVLDAAACLVIGALAATVRRDLWLPAAVFAALNPTQIVVGGLVLTDSLFMLAAALSLLAVFRWLSAPGWRLAATLGLALGAAAMTRAMILPWMGVLAAFLFTWTLWQRRDLGPRLGQLALAAGLAAMVLSPVIARNLTLFDTAQLSAQGGMHALYWVVPLVMEARDGTSHTEGARLMRERFEPVSEPAHSADPFLRSRVLLGHAGTALAELGPVAVAKAWARGILLNLGAPAVSIAPPAARLPRTGFYATEGPDAFAKIWRFLFANDSPLYAWLLIAGGLGVAALRVVQLTGLVSGPWREPAARLLMLLLLVWCAFVLLVAGPIAATEIPPAARARLRRILRARFHAPAPGLAPLTSPVQTSAPTAPSGSVTRKGRPNRLSSTTTRSSLAAVSNRPICSAITPLLTRTASPVSNGGGAVTGTAPFSSSAARISSTTPSGTGEGSSPLQIRWLTPTVEWIARQRVAERSMCTKRYPGNSGRRTASIRRAWRRRFR